MSARMRLRGVGDKPIARIGNMPLSQITNKVVDCVINRRDPVVIKCDLGTGYLFAVAKKGGAADDIDVAEIVGTYQSLRGLAMFKMFDVVRDDVLDFCKEHRFDHTKKFDQRRTAAGC